MGGIAFRRGLSGDRFHRERRRTGRRLIGLLHRGGHPVANHSAPQSEAEHAGGKDGDDVE